MNRAKKNTRSIYRFPTSCSPETTIPFKSIFAQPCHVWTDQSCGFRAYWLHADELQQRASYPHHQHAKLSLAPFRAAEVTETEEAW
ncbi:Hypothetical predicted protein [Podarcis lilfordi]|uniref:Uncharacterized protein n=1 Tax=Podarcis lilfordi TaxID=74358 RepID=A0AA35NVJ7_9SAUR|nr:Hypothetical predicted protein [Podarcis lilfordi]